MPIDAAAARRQRNALPDVNPSLFHRLASACCCAVLAAVFLGGCGTVPEKPVGVPPAAPREFRAAWVATVANIDWPSVPGLPVEKQKAEIAAILDRAHALKLNAIILQVRPAADAMYASTLEPWSEYLTGKQGQAPEPFYDPLHVWIDEAHRRGIELHAWINPYRARHFTAKSELAATHFAKTHPEAVKRYGDYLWMDPGEPAAMRHTLDVVGEIVRNYDVDAVHIDDYFYPYPIRANQGAREAYPAPPISKQAQADLDFPDEPAWRRYIAGGGRLSRADWRRQNVDQLVEAIYREVHRIKPWVRFGVSPFGIGRPDRRPSGINGFSQYDKLYANVELWLARGWMDYLVPQLYWQPGQRGKSFDALLKYWARQNAAKRHLWPGLFTSGIDDTPTSWQPNDIIGEISLTRANPAASGHAHYSMIALMQNRRGITDLLRAKPYPQAALVPATLWLGATAPSAPELKLVDLPARHIEIGIGKEEKVALFAIWKRYGKRWEFSTQPAAEPTVDLAPEPQREAVDAVVVSAVDRLGNESARATLFTGEHR